MTVTMSETETQLKQLYTYLLDQKDHRQAKKVLELIEKLKKQQMMIGFAGHFSAGKSTLINTLLQYDILPSSPIPTSANIVKLTSGEPYTITHFNYEPPVKYEGDIDFDTVQKLCKNGEEIVNVEISRPIETIPSYVTVLDTPGVDSTNDADRLITESSLHLMDYMYYVMDYNHVQSEVNLSFLKEMEKRGTPFSIVVNQVDKHMEEELTFKEFKESVSRSLSRWGITPEYIYYTSLKDFSLPINDIKRLRQEFEDLFQRSYDQINQQARGEAKAIIEESVQDRSEAYDHTRQKLVERRDRLTDQINQSHLDEQMDHPKERQQQKITQGETRFQERILTFIPNAYLMPSTLREDAKDYLEAMQPGFKVGVLFTRKKTEEAIVQREQNFYNHLQDVVEKNLKWPLRERMLEILDELSITDPSLIESIQSFKTDYDINRLKKNIAPGASVTGDYVLRYTEQVSKDIQQYFRSVVNQWWEQIEKLLNSQMKEEYEQHKDIYAAIEEKSQILSRLKELETDLLDYKQNLYDQLVIEAVSSRVEKRVEEDLGLKDQRLVRKDAYESKIEDPTVESLTDKEDDRPEKVQQQSSVQQTLQKAEQARSIASQVDGMEELYNQLSNKIDRLKSRQYTVALFGAFSAGKSSFANALLGDRVLPVSPNPTTATINKISPPTSEQPDRTIVVKMKTEEQLLDDLSYIMQKLGLSNHSVDELYQTVQGLSEDQWNELDYKQHSFLQAFINGFSDMGSSLGEEISIHWEEFSSFVAEEKKSCFIEWMELFYDCHWTRAGITLVDTPGADSVNARHTDVSFEYIKNADAVLFVTYYNHPFSKADQSFLTQLGRVKDTFAMDKMFFIINAADLASTDQEVQQVETYLEDQLLGFNIRHPRLYSLSSLLALREKQGDSIEKDSGIQAFEEGFYTFLSEELAEVLIQSILHDMKAMNDTLSSFIEHANLDHEEREKQLTLYKREKKEVLQVFDQVDKLRKQQSIHNKIEKQIHYVYERMMLNFNDYFKRYFNPATINGQGAEVKDQLNEAAEELVKEVEFEMKQELRAVSIRIERFLSDQLLQVQKELQAEIQKVRPVLDLPDYEWEGRSVPTFDLAIPVNDKEVQVVLKQFRGAKSFFEKNEKEEMKDRLASLISPILYKELGKGEDMLQQYYLEQWQEIVMDAKSYWYQQMEDTFRRLAYNLRNPADVSHLEKCHHQLQEIL